MDMIMQGLPEHSVNNPRHDLGGVLGFADTTLQLDVASIAFSPERSTTESMDESMSHPLLSLVFSNDLLVQVTKVGLGVSNGISSLYGVQGAIVKLLGGTIKDIKFAGEDIMLVLWDTAGELH